MEWMDIVCIIYGVDTMECECLQDKTRAQGQSFVNTAIQAKSINVNSSEKCRCFHSAYSA
jgi:hypothetical protein